MTLLSKLLCLLLSCLILLPILTGCVGDTNATPSITDDTWTDAVTEAPAEEIPLPDYSQMKVRARTSILNSDLGLRASTFQSSDPYVAELESFRRDLQIYIYNPGVTEVKLTDAFGHTASFTLTVTEDFQFSTTVQKCSESFLEVTAFGAKADNSNDDSAAFQAMIDAAKPGETVYAYAGNYYVSFIRMREGVTLRLATTMTDAKEGYSARIQKEVKQGGKFAVLRGVRIMNNDTGQRGSEGSSYFKVEGGILDMDSTTRGAVIFGCADGVQLENIIFKNIKNNHAIQLTGCTNSTINNCMFAGYVMGSVFTREVVQVEPSAPGATGEAATAPLRFYEGEYYLPENITIKNCYFGKSDTAGAPLMAIGHHSQVGKPNVTGLSIVGNVFDECIYAAIRYNNVCDVVIENNTFIATAEWNNNTRFSEATTPAFIILYHNTGKKTYTNVVDQTTIVEAEACEQAGIHNLSISGNTFRIGKGSDKRVFYYEGLTSYTPGAQYTENPIHRQENYNSTPVDYTGYVVRSNYGRNISFCENEILVEGQPTYTDHLIYVKGVYKLTLAENNYQFADGVSFSSVNGQQTGVLLTSIFDKVESTTFTIHTAQTDRKIFVRYGGRIYHTLSTTAAVTLLLYLEAVGDILLSTDDAGNLYIDVVNGDLDKLNVRDVNCVPIAENVTLSADTALLIGYAK